jgi:hypothetical protein
MIVGVVVGALLMSHTPNVASEYEQAIHCWVDLQFAARIGPELGIAAPSQTIAAGDNWRARATALGGQLNKDENAIKADAKAYLDQLTAAVDQGPWNEVSSSILARAQRCEAIVGQQH